MYKVKKSKKFNILTSETAVLENMHCATFFNIIQLNRNLDIFQHLQSDEERNLAKRIIITCILATDMVIMSEILGKALQTPGEILEAGRGDHLAHE